MDKYIIDHRVETPRGWEERSSVVDGENEIEAITNFMSEPASFIVGIDEVSGIEVQEVTEISYDDE